MSTTTAPERKNIIYTIPGSTLTLDIILDERKHLSRSLIASLLSGANHEASKHPQSTTLEGVFTWTTPDAEAEQGKKAVFGIAGGPILNEMTWGDVCVLTQGLKEWFEQEREEVGLLFYVRDEGRGALGDGYLEPVVEAVVMTEVSTAL
ncbi:uncharacterized protein KY384_004998 [Bacidia gigantensis]|uniref:uncharacterized protein n=1 Tax=Bacidia gigantensis TaxID=2732470 RepID=UPI001D0519E9|nr:uncharacterized protein KY384_004998 [Bacidia gigantensis]KAG8530495.1 hypothetical protein KY384_004998 [Bacidia gigantensis]